MRIFLFPTLVALNATLLIAAEFTPEYKGSRPITVHTVLTADKKGLHFKETVQNLTNEPLQNVRLCLKIDTIKDGCVYEWDSHLLEPGKGGTWPHDVPMLNVKPTAPGEEVPHSIEIMFVTQGSTQKEQPVQASCGAYGGPVKFDVELKPPPGGWAIRPYVEDVATKGKTYFETSSTKPPVAKNPYKNRWTFSLEVPGATQNMKPEARSWNCEPAGVVDIDTVARITNGIGQEIAVDWQWAKDDTQQHYAWLKLVGKIKPARPLTLRGTELRIERIVSAQLLNDSQTEFLNSEQLAKLQPEPGSAIIQIPIQPEFEQKTARITALTYFESNKTQTRPRIFCFPLIGGSEINLDEKERGEGCVDNSREIRFNIMLRGQPYGRDVQFGTRGPKGNGTETLGSSHPYLKGRNLPDAILLVNDPDFENGEWNLKDGSAMTIALKPRERILTLQFTDESGNLVNEAISGRAAVTNEPDSLIPTNAPYRIALRVIPSDLIHITASSQSHGADATVQYDATRTVLSVRMTLKAAVAPIEQLSIKVRPYFKVRGQEQLLNASVKILYEASNGSSESTVLQRDRDFYVGSIAKHPNSPLTASIDLSPVQARVLAMRPSYAIDGRPDATNPIEASFSKPTLAVMINPSERFRHVKQASWLDEIKQQSWRVFEQLNDPKWDKELGYRYFSTISDSQQQIEPLKLVETTTLDTSSESRENVVRNIAFNSVEVSSLSASQSYARFLNGFSYAASAKRGYLVYIQATETAPLESGDVTIDELDGELGRQGIKALIVQLSPGSGEPRTLTQAKHRNLKLIQFYMDTEIKTYFRQAFDQVISDLTMFQEAK